VSLVTDQEDQSNRGSRGTDTVHPEYTVLGCSHLTERERMFNVWANVLPDPDVYPTHPHSDTRLKHGTATNRGSAVVRRMLSIAQTRYHYKTITLEHPLNIILYYISSCCSVSMCSHKLLLRVNNNTAACSTSQSYCNKSIRFSNIHC
jgi:hypothetical protein